MRGNIQWTVFSMHLSYVCQSFLQNKRTPKTISWCVPKKGGQPHNLAGGLPRHEAPTPEMCTAAPAAFQVTTCRNGWMKEPKTGSFRTVSRWRMIKDTQLAWFLHGKAIPQCHPGGHGLVPLLGQGSSTWCQKLAFLDSSPYPAATPGLYMPVPQPPTWLWSLISMRVFIKSSSFI